MQVYVAAPLFTEAERAFNLVLTRAFEAEAIRSIYRSGVRLRPRIMAKTAIFYANLTALRTAKRSWPCAMALRSTAARLGNRLRLRAEYSDFCLRTHVRIVQRSDEQINLIILECLRALSPTIEQ